MRLSSKYAVPAIFLIFIFSLIPLAIMTGVSFFKTNFITWEFVRLENYTKLFHSMYIKGMLNSLLYSACYSIPTSGIGFILAIAMADLKMRLKNTMMAFFMFPMFSAGIIISQTWRWLIRVYNIPMNKTFIGIPFISMTLLISVAGAGIMYYAIAIKNINPAQYEAAHMDGATWFQIKTRIIMPQLLPMFGVMLLFSLISGFQIWEAIYILAPYDSTASSLYRVISDGFFFGKYGFASAECIGMILIIFIITKIKERIETH